METNFIERLSRWFFGYFLINFSWWYFFHVIKYLFPVDSEDYDFCLVAPCILTIVFFSITIFIIGIHFMDSSRKIIEELEE